MATGDELRLKVVGRCQQQNIVNSMAFQITDQQGLEEDVCQNLCDAFLDTHGTAWLARHSEDYELIGCKAYRQGGAAKVPGQVLSGLSGTVVESSLPASICRTITLYADDDNPRRRGRIMLSGTTASMMDSSDGGVSVAEVALVEDLADDLLNPLAYGGDAFLLVLGSTIAHGMLQILTARARRTPAGISSRTIRELLIG